MLNEIRDILLSIVLFIFFKPVLLVGRLLLSKKAYKALSFKLITFTNNVFGYYRDQLSDYNKIKYDMRKYRDTYDRKGLELYFQLVSAEDLFLNKKILDFGCGVGGKALEILKYNPEHVMGIDLSKRDIDYAKELLNDSNKSKLFFEYKDILDLKDPESFDSIVSFTVFEHVDTPLLLPILDKMYELLKKNGNLLIVFNHFNDRFGSHLKEYIFHPWPQSLFDEEMIYEYWNQSLISDKNSNDNSYFPKNYRHGVGNHNEDCYINLNKLNISDFEKIIKQTKFKYVDRYDYSRLKILDKLNFLPSKYLQGSSVYYLKKG
ncbi:MAG: class I SAM-dependent methyltransferase [Candidatus Dojkabacteria bacterium]